MQRRSTGGHQAPHRTDVHPRPVTGPVTGSAMEPATGPAHVGEATHASAGAPRWRYQSALQAALSLHRGGGVGAGAGAS
jgi:hypothetical protein